MSDPREEARGDKYDLGVPREDKKEESYIDELMNYKPEFEGVEEGRDEDD